MDYILQRLRRCEFSAWITFYMILGRGCSATALTPPTVLEKGTALTNSHWICTGEIFNSWFLTKYKVIDQKVQTCEHYILKKIVWFHEDLKVLDNFSILFTSTFNERRPLRVGRQIRERLSEQPKQQIANRHPLYCTNLL